jgi:DNA-directed RNA polymerase specialized sigma54-like protein
MKQSLQLKIGQSLTMTPQLQQAIKLLQLSSLELQTEIQNALDNNLMNSSLSLILRPTQMTTHTPIIKMKIALKSLVRNSGQMRYLSI